MCIGARGVRVGCRFHDKGNPAARRGRKAHGSHVETAGLPKGDLLLQWIALGLAGGSLVAAVATLILVWTMRQSVFRAERTGEERLEMLREQQQRLEFMHEERRISEEELEWRRSMMVDTDGPLEHNAAPESNGHS